MKTQEAALRVKKVGWTFCSASLLGTGVSWACALHKLGLAICKTGDGIGSRVPLQRPMKPKPTRKQHSGHADAHEGALSVDQASVHALLALSPLGLHGDPKDFL